MQRSSERIRVHTIPIIALMVGLLIALVPSQAVAQSSTEEEVLAAIESSFANARKNLKGDPDEVSKDGMLAFWSSGGLLQEISAGAPPIDYEYDTTTPKHIKVITLVEGQAAVALFYSEGSFQIKGRDPVDHYMTRAMQVWVKEDGRWKTRAAHWSPISGGSGTNQTATASP